MVVAIIGILASMLLPSLGKAKRIAKQTICINNLKQIGLWINMYGDDNDGAFPRAWKDELSWDDLLSDYDGRKLTQAQLDGYTPPVKSQDITYKCALDFRKLANESTRTYAVNAEVIGDYPWGRAGVNNDTLNSTSSSILMSERIPSSSDNGSKSTLGDDEDCRAFTNVDLGSGGFPSWYSNHPKSDTLPWLFADIHIDIRGKNYFTTFTAQ